MSFNTNNDEMYIPKTYPSPDMKPDARSQV